MKSGFRAEHELKTLCESELLPAGIVRADNEERTVPFTYQAQIPRLLQCVVCRDSVAERTARV